LIAFRTRVTPGDPDRDFVYTWGGTAPGREQLSSAEAFYDTSHHGLYRLGPDAVPGPLALGGVTAEVVAAPARPLRRVPATEGSLAAIKKATANGPVDLFLNPGLHRWDDTVVLPGGTRVFGYGAHVAHGYKAASFGNNWPILFLAGGDISIYGVTFRHTRPGSVFYANPAVAGLVLADCTFRNCNLGFFATGAFVRDCDFIAAGATIAPGGLYLRCRFFGPPGTHAFCYWSGQGPLAVLDCVFDGTDRGPTFNTAWGPQHGHLFVGTACRNINGTLNGNEIFAFEGPGPFNNHVINHTRVTDCQGAVLQWGGNADGHAEANSVRDLFVDGGSGISFWGGAVGNTVEDFELRNGAGIYCGTQARDNVFRNGSVINWAPGRGNQHWQNPSHLGHLRTLAVLDEGVNNVLDAVHILDTSKQGFNG
jgi:hypothetical protein